MQFLTPNQPLFAAIFLVALAAAAPAAADETIRLAQKPDIALEHQRMPGNARAQAETRGVIRSAPHLFVYHPDPNHTPAFYMKGDRRGFDRQLSMVLEDFREQRSMVPLERLLENAGNADGETLTPGDLPRRRAVFVLFVSDECPACDSVAEALDDWLARRPAYEAVRIEIELP